MFFILIVLIAAVLLVAALAVRIKAAVRIDQSDINAKLRLLYFIPIKWRFVLRRDKTSIIRLIRIKKDGSEKTMISLAELICRLDKKKQTHKEHARSAAFNHVYERMNIEINAKAQIGLGDAFATAMLCGALSMGFGIAQRIGKPKHHRIKLAVLPVFTKQLYSFCADCIITLSPVNIIVGYIIYLKNLRR